MPTLTVVQGPKETQTGTVTQTKGRRGYHMEYVPDRNRSLFISVGDVEASQHPVVSDPKYGIVLWAREHEQPTAIEIYEAPRILRAYEVMHGCIVHADRCRAEDHPYPKGIPLKELVRMATAIAVAAKLPPRAKIGEARSFSQQALRFVGEFMVPIDVLEQMGGVGLLEEVA